MSDISRSTASATPIPEGASNLGGASTPGEPSTPERPVRLGRRLAWLRFGRDASLVLAINLTVALLFTTIGGLGRFSETLVQVNAVGFCIWGVARLLYRLARGKIPQFATLPIAIPLGLVVGGKLAALLGTTDFIALIARDPVHEWRSLAGDLILGCIATVFFMLYTRAQTLHTDLQSERRRAAEALQSETSARLALLQAQIEPHFLFNTLANVRSTMESNPATAKAILDNLDRYLRVSLDRTRRASSTLGEELGLVRAILEIAALRLGDRLRFTIVAPKALYSATLPPLLLQPLVENALQHGIEPSVAGGEIHVAAQREGESLILRVVDSGVGLDAAAPEGVGLANVRARLESLYGGRGRLAIYRNAPQGVIAELLIPLRST